MSPVSDRVQQALAAYDLDPARAVQQMRAAAEDDDPHACLNMANWHLYYRASGASEEDRAMAAAWLARLEHIAEGGNADAQYEIAKCYREGKMLPRDLDRANLWLQRAAESGVGPAQHELALLLEKGADGLPQDRGASEAWFSRALAQGEHDTHRLLVVRRFRETMQVSDELHGWLRTVLFTYTQLYGLPPKWRIIYRPSRHAFVLVVETAPGGEDEDRDWYREWIDEALEMGFEGVDVPREIRFATAPASEPSDEVLMSDEIFREMIVELAARQPG